MKIIYDPQAGAVYVEIMKHKTAHQTKRVGDKDDSVMADLSEKGEVLGIEILDVKEIEIKVGRSQ